MSEYNPDAWVMLKITTSKYSVYKVLAGWYGGFANGDRWKLNSGCTSVEKDGEFLVFSGWSGSTYRVHPNTYRLTGLTTQVLSNFQKEIEGTADASIEVMPEETNWMELNYD